MPSLQSGRSILTEKDSAFNRPWLVEEMEALQKDWIPLGAQLDISGQLSQPERPPTERAAGAPPANFADADGPAQAADAPLELHPKKPTRATEEADIAWAIQKSERSGPGWFKWIAFAVLIASGAAGILKGKEIYSKGFEIYSLFSRRVGLPPLRPPPTALLRIESEPSGAKIEIGSQVLGETPLFVENIYPKSEIEVKLSLKGYRPWTGKFAGGQTAELKARLHRR
jgi:hypothetical protein